MSDKRTLIDGTTIPMDKYHSLLIERIYSEKHGLKTKVTLLADHCPAYSRRQVDMEMKSKIGPSVELKAGKTLTIKYWPIEVDITFRNSGGKSIVTEKEQQNKKHFRYEVKIPKQVRI